MKWQFLLLVRNKLITISVLVTLVYVALFFGIREAVPAEKVLVLLIMNDPAVIGWFFAGVIIMMEYRQNLLAALLVSPGSLHTYLLARILPLSVVGWACALGMALAAVGTQLQLVYFSVGVMGICLLSCLLGVFIVSYTFEFLQFTLRSVPVMLLVNLPLLNYFGLTQLSLFGLSPFQPGLDLIAASFQSGAPAGKLALAALLLLGWCGLLYLLVYRMFKSRILKL